MLKAEKTGYLITQSTKGLEFKLAGGRYYNYSFSTEKWARFYHGVRMSAIWSYVGHP